MNTLPHLTLGPIGVDGSHGISTVGSAASSSAVSISHTFDAAWRVGDLVTMENDQYNILYEIEYIAHSLGGKPYYHLVRWRDPKQRRGGAPRNRLCWAGRVNKRVLEQWLSGWYYVRYDSKRPMPHSPEAA